LKTKQLSIAAQLFAAEQERRRLSRIAMMIRELSVGLAKLNEEIAAEEKRTRVSDRMHVCYSTYARAAAQRRDNLIRTIEELRLRGDGQRSIAA